MIILSLWIKNKSKFKSKPNNKSKPMLCETHVFIIFIFIFIFIYNKLLLSITNMMSIHDDVEYNYDVMKWHNLYNFYISNHLFIWPIFSFSFFVSPHHHWCWPPELNSFNSFKPNQIKSNQSAHEVA